MARIKHARPALVVVVLALIAAVAGTALAGSGPDANTAANKAKKALSKANKALNKAKKNKKAIKNIELTPGPQGLPGTKGDPGDPAAGRHEAEGRTIANDTTETIFNLAEGTIRVRCEDVPDLIYDNNSGATATAWNDRGLADPTVTTLINGAQQQYGVADDDTHALTVLTDDHVAFVDFNMERTAVPDCIVALQLVEYER